MPAPPITLQGWDRNDHARRVRRGEQMRLALACLLLAAAVAWIAVLTQRHAPAPVDCTAVPEPLVHREMQPTLTPGGPVPLAPGYGTQPPLKRRRTGGGRRDRRRRRARREGPPAVVINVARADGNGDGWRQIAREARQRAERAEMRHLELDRDLLAVQTDRQELIGKLAKGAEEALRLERQLSDTKAQGESLRLDDEAARDILMRVLTSLDFDTTDGEWPSFRLAYHVERLLKGIEEQVRDACGTMTLVAQERDAFRRQLAASEDARRKHAEENTRLVHERDDVWGKWARIRDTLHTSREDLAGVVEEVLAERDAAQARITELLGEGQELRQTHAAACDVAQHFERLMDTAAAELTAAQALRCEVPETGDQPALALVRALRAALDRAEHARDGWRGRALAAEMDRPRRVGSWSDLGRSCPGCLGCEPDQAHPMDLCGGSGWVASVPSEQPVPATQPEAINAPPGIRAKVEPEIPLTEMRREVERLTRQRDEAKQTAQVTLGSSDRAAQALRAAQELAEVLRRQRDEARGEVTRLHGALGMGHPWPVHDVLTKLADAVDHLSEHDCDAHGHEEVRYARDAARRIVSALAGDEVAPLGTASVGCQPLDKRCDSCWQGPPREACPSAKRVCGHHCNHTWSHERCCWCGAVFGADESPAPLGTAPGGYEVPAESPAAPPAARLRSLLGHEPVRPVGWSADMWGAFPGEGFPEDGPVLLAYREDTLRNVVSAAGLGCDLTILPCAVDGAFDNDVSAIPADVATGQEIDADVEQRLDEAHDFGDAPRCRRCGRHRLDAAASCVPGGAS